MNICESPAVSTRTLISRRTQSKSDLTNILLIRDFLKMDIEFAEFDSMTAFLEDFAGQKLPIGQFLVEIHLFKSKITTEKFLQW